MAHLLLELLFKLFFKEDWMKRQKLFLSAITAGAFALASVPLHAASSAPVGLNVTASVAAQCIVSSTTDVAFGPYDPLGANASVDLLGQGQVGIKCTPGSGASIAIDSGANPSGNQRRMAAAGGSLLNYGLYTDGGRNTAWGNGSNGASPLSISTAANAAEQLFDVYGLVPMASAQPGAFTYEAGNYSDIVQVTVNF